MPRGTRPRLSANGGAGPLELAWNPTSPPQNELLIDAGSQSIQMDTNGWRSAPMEANVRSPGCYAYQIDGFGFTEFITFKASR